MVIEGSTTNATVYINGIGKADERRINIAFFYPAIKSEYKFPGSIGIIVRLDDNNTLKGQRVILSAEKLDCEKKREEMLKHLTNDDKNRDVFIDRYNVGELNPSLSLQIPSQYDTIIAEESQQGSDNIDRTIHHCWVRANLRG